MGVGLPYNISSSERVKQPLSPRIVTRQVPFYPDLLLRPPPRLPDLKEKRGNVSGWDLDINTDFEEDLP